jgi:zinc transport system substrate-binding protein
VVALALLGTGCGGRPGAAAPRGTGANNTGAHPGGDGPAHALDVVASAYPLAQLARYLGGKYADVTDLASPLLDPRGLHLTSHQVKLVHDAGLVVVVGDGYQPSVEAAADGARHHIALLPAVSHQVLPYEFWLDPSLMSKAATFLASAMTKADPPAARQFANGARDMRSVASSLSSDLQSNLANCTKTEFVTEDTAFSRMANAFGLHDVAISTAGPSKAASVVRQENLPVVFAEAGPGSSGAEQVAALTGATVKTLDPMEVAPAPGTEPVSYFAVMEEDLTYLQTGLSCDISSNFS